MNMESIANKMKSNHQAFIQTISSLGKNEFEYSMHGKWSAGQVLDHLCRSVDALSIGLLLPKQLIRYNFGMPDRPSAGYEGLVSQYRELLSKGGKASGRYLPEMVSFSNRNRKMTALQKSVDKICRRLSRFSEPELDQYLLPHPLLGRITLREMLYFTIYHVEHHGLILKKDLEQFM